LDSIGVRYLTISRGTMRDRNVCLICITHCVKVESASAPEELAVYTTLQNAA
jgi:hypothetical protein